MPVTAKLENGLEVGEVGKSAYRALCHALGTPQSWESISPEHQSAFFELARSAGSLLQKYEGAPWAEVAKEVYALFHAPLLHAGVVPFAQISSLGKLAWEAVSRHLTCLHDAGDQEDLGDLADLEASWKLWCFQRLNTLKVGSEA